MSPYTRRMVAAAAIGATIATAGALNHPGDATANAEVDRIAPGGNITSVVRATAARGWPHAPTTRERRDVAAIVVNTYTPANVAGGTFCRFGVYLGRVSCTLQVGPRVYRVAVRVFEDGSYRMGRRAGA